MTATLEQLAHVLAAWARLNVADRLFADAAANDGMPELRDMFGLQQAAKNRLADAARAAGMIPSGRTATWQADEIAKPEDLLAAILEVAPPESRTIRPDEVVEVHVRMNQADLERMRAELEEVSAQALDTASKVHDAACACPTWRRMVQLTDDEIAALQHAATHFVDDVITIPECAIDRAALRDGMHVLHDALRRGAR